MIRKSRSSAPDANGSTHRLRREDMRELGRYTAAEDPCQNTLAQFWADATDLDRVGLDDDFFALGGTSVQAASLFDRIEREFDLILPLATLYNAPTVRALAAEISGRTNGTRPAAEPTPTRSQRLVPVRAEGRKPPLFISAGIGGGVVGLAHFTSAFDDDRPVYGLESRGLDGAEKPLFDMGDIAAEYLEEITAVQPDGPIDLFGVCWGALVMLEIATRLQAAGRSIGMLALLDPPPLRGRGNPLDRSKVASVLTLPGFVAARLGLYYRTLADLPRDRRKAYVRERLQALREIVRKRDLFRGDSSELWRRKVYRANQIAARKYSPPDFRGPVKMLFTTERPDGRSRAARGDWMRRLDVGDSVVYVPGRDTSNAMSAEFARHVAAALNPGGSNQQ